MFGRIYKSFNSSESKEEFGFLPYKFETKRTQVKI